MINLPWNVLLVPQEDETLLELALKYAIKDERSAGDLKVQYGTWAKVAACLPGRSATQCRQRFNYYLKEVGSNPRATYRTILTRISRPT